MEATQATYDQIRGELIAKRSSVAAIARGAGCTPAWARAILRREAQPVGPKGQNVVKALRDVLGRNPLAEG